MYLSIIYTLKFSTKLSCPVLNLSINALTIYIILLFLKIDEFPTQ